MTDVVTTELPLGINETEDGSTGIKPLTREELKRLGSKARLVEYDPVFHSHHVVADGFTCLSMPSARERLALLHGLERTAQVAAVEWRTRPDPRDHGRRGH
jgi:hypothetical protein